MLKRTPKDRKPETLSRNNDTNDDEKQDNSTIRNEHKLRQTCAAHVQDTYKHQNKNKIKQKETPHKRQRIKIVTEPTNGST